VLHFFCPTSLASFETGIILDRQTYDRQRLTIVSVDCKYCEKQHRFLIADGSFRCEEAA